MTALSLPRGTETILLVDDEEALRCTSARILAKLGYTVLQATDGPEALELARAHAGAVNLVLCDTIMPRLAGPKVFAALRAEGHNMPFVLTSGQTPDDLGPTLTGGMRFLQKPWSVSELAGAVRRALETSVVPRR